jgi:hypothetical protein
VTVALLGGARIKQAKGQVLNGEIHSYGKSHIQKYYDKLVG